MAFVLLGLKGSGSRNKTDSKFFFNTDSNSKIKTGHSYIKPNKTIETESLSYITLMYIAILCWKNKETKKT